MQGRIHASVLVVDDDEQFLDVVSQRLEGRGLEVATATSGGEALDAIRGKRFDTVVLDFVMPGMSGIETLRQLRERQPDLRVIVLTGHGSIEVGIEAMKLGAEDLIEKPVDLQVLLERIQEASDKRTPQAGKSGKGDE
jgi:DNA-binding NtrC family response regulator